MSNYPANASHQFDIAEAIGPKAFGLSLSTLDVPGAARHMIVRDARTGNPAKLFVTANIQHISLMRRDRAMRDVLENVDLLTCDGFPVAWYARLRGCRIPGRITGREVVDELLHRTDLDETYRLFFLVDSAETAQAVTAWAASQAAGPAVMVEVAPMQFGADEDYCAKLALRITAFQTTLLFLGVGAPRSELFAAQYRAQLQDCWVLCIGQSIKISLGMVTVPPRIVVAMNIEWLWRIALEPRRLIRRYSEGIVGFGLAVIEDLRLGTLRPVDHARQRHS